MPNRTTSRSHSLRVENTERGYGFLVKDGYIFVYQDIRGKFKSEGEFVMQRAPRVDRKDPKAIDESTDAYDTIDWLLKNIPNNNGRVGMTGVSRLDPRFAALQLCTVVLGQLGTMGRLGTRARGEAGLAYYAYAALEDALAPGLWTARIGVGARATSSWTKCND